MEAMLLPGNSSRSISIIWEETSVIGTANDNPFSTLIKPDPESSRVAGTRRSKSEKKPSRSKAILLGLIALASLVLLVVIVIKTMGGE